MVIKIRKISIYHCGNCDFYRRDIYQKPHWCNAKGTWISKSAMYFIRFTGCLFNSYLIKNIMKKFNNQEIQEIIDLIQKRSEQE